MKFVFIIIAFAIIGLLIYLIIRFILQPLFFPRVFPKKEMNNLLINNGYKYISHINISKKNVYQSELLEENSPFYNPLFFHISFYKVFVNDLKNNKESILFIRWVKSYSFFAKNKINYIVGKDSE